MVEIVSITQPFVEGISTPEDLVCYIARVSNPENQMNTETSNRLIKFLMRHKHWSPFEMVDITVSIKTSRAIAAQLLRHRSFSFQEFSQRYSSVAKNTEIELRKSGAKNRQSSTDIIEDDALIGMVNLCIDNNMKVYQELLSKGVARETARMVLPLSCETHIYMKGSLRSWIHYLELRCAEDTQKEHRIIADDIKNKLKEHFPNIFSL